LKNKWIMITCAFMIVATLSFVNWGMKKNTNIPIANEMKPVVINKLPVIGSKEKLTQHFKDAIEYQEKQHLTFRGDMEYGEAEMAVSSDTKASGSASYSETNVQVQGIDEADIVKTDGTYIYEVQEGEVVITKAMPANEMSIQARIKNDDNFHPFQLFLHENNLVVIGQSYDAPVHQSRLFSEDDVVFDIMPIMNGMTKAMIYDISERSKPTKIREIALEGFYSSSRKIDGNIYLVSNQHPMYWMMENNPEIDLRPKYKDSLTNNETVSVTYDKIQFFPGSKETNFLMIAAFNLDEPEQEAAITTYLGSSGSMYMSKENLYLGVTDYSSPITTRAAELEYNTDIYKFSINGTKVDFHSSGKIPGTILNQFSMDEYDGYFRVATTVGNSWNEEKPSENKLIIMDENLKKVGELNGLARGERIYSARFMNDRIYLVTFKETDPLFVIDAADPKAPKILGELKIPGFSNYLHPYDDSHIIGFGIETEETPGVGSGFKSKGVKISIFDVSDVSNPKEKFKEVIGSSWTYSPLNYDHKALLFDKERKLFAFPIHVFEEIADGSHEKEVFQGGYIYEIDLDKGLQLKEKITHRQGKNDDEIWNEGITRMIYIGDHLYALSPAKITAHRFGDFKLVGELNK